MYHNAKNVFIFTILFFEVNFQQMRIFYIYHKGFSHKKFNNIKNNSKWVHILSLVLYYRLF